MRESSAKLKSRLKNFIIKIEEELFKINHPTPIDVPANKLIYVIPRSPYKTETE